MIYPEDLDEDGLIGAAARAVVALRNLPLISTATIEILNSLEEAVERELPAEMRGGRGGLYEFGEDVRGRVWCVVGFSYPGDDEPETVLLRDALTGEDSEVLVPEYRALKYVGAGNAPPKDWKNGDRVINHADIVGVLEKQGRGKSAHWRVQWPSGGPTPFYQESRVT